MTTKVTQQLPTQYDKLSSSEHEPIVLVCAADDNYAMPLAVTLRSALENLGDQRKLSIFIIDGGIEADNKRKIAISLQSDKVANLAWLNPNENLITDLEVGGSSYITKATFYRLLIPELLPEHQKAIYLDSDLVINADLGNLWDIDIEDRYLLAARDLYFPPILTTPCTNFLQSNGLKIDTFFNAGVLSINLEKWRLEKTGTEVVKFISQHKLPSDQEGLNIVLKDKWKEINPQWNQACGIYECESWEKSPFSEELFTNLVNNPFIIHFTSADKPWNSIGRHPAQPLFYHYLDMTAWSGWRFTQWKRIQRRLNREASRIWGKISPIK
jgi:lipopolysaccharide biosynthesis glycosyltransferase